MILDQLDQWTGFPDCHYVRARACAHARTRAHVRNAQLLVQWSNPSFLEA